MTNEQREAIEICKEKIIESFYDFPNPTSIELKDTDVEAIEIVLSLIKEQQAEMEDLKNKSVLIKRYFKKCDLIKQKDKQIDLMAKFIENNMSEKKIINEICIKSKCNNEECHEDDLKDCIKQYFERKVEDVKDSR